MSYKVVSLFSGLAGLDLGFSERVIVHRDSVDEEFIECEAPQSGFVSLKRLPFTTVFQNDILPSAKEIAEWNGWANNYVLRDIRELLDEEYAFPQADVVTGGFPCQDFSHSGKRKGLETSRGTLYQSFVEVVKRVKPTVFIAENVNGLLTMPGKPIEQIVSDFSDVGYQVKYQLIKCEEFGIPQTRWRVIIMGVKNERCVNLPEDWNIITKNRRICKIGSYFKHLDEPEVTEDSAQMVYSKAARLEKGQGQKEVGLDEFGPTMRAEHHGNIEFRRITGGKNGEDTLPQRRLTVREAGLIQTFPPDCILTEPNKKPTMKAYKPIGNAVPPLLGYLVADKVHELLKT
jgi:DNA (cytosine-5)-methyltransferase 1